MSNAITWRNVDAPDLRSSAAIMNAGNESINQGISSLAALAKGYADEQKGIAVSNAVADLSNTTNDADRRSVFAAHSAKLRDSGIDLKEFIAADQAKHASITADGVASDNHAMSVSTIDKNKSGIETDALGRVGLAIKNQSDQKIFDHLGVVQEQKDAAAAMDLAVSRANIHSSDASAAASGASAKNSIDAISERGLVRKERLAREDTQNEVARALLDPDNATGVDANGNPVIDIGKVVANELKLKRNILDINAGIADYDTTQRRPEIVALKAAAAKKLEDRDLASFKQSLETNTTDRKDAKTALQAAQDTDTWFGQDTDKIAGDAAIASAFATRVKDPSGKEVSFSPADIQRFVTESSSGGDITIDKFNNRLKMEAAALHNGETVKGDQKLTAEDMLKNGARR